MSQAELLCGLQIKRMTLWLTSSLDLLPGGQVTRPAGDGDQRVTKEHLARLTQYVTHLEAS